MFISFYSYKAILSKTCAVGSDFSRSRAIAISLVEQLYLQKYSNLCSITAYFFGGMFLCFSFMMYLWARLHWKFEIERNKYSLGVFNIACECLKRVCLHFLTDSSYTKLTSMFSNP